MPIGRAAGDPLLAFGKLSPGWGASSNPTKSAILRTRLHFVSPDRVIGGFDTAVEPAAMNQDPGNRRLRRLDIGLLMIFQEVMAMGHLKVAAVNLGLTQAAVSHGLRRLSHILGFQLFTRSRGAVTPTDRATEIAPAVGLIVATALALIAQDANLEGASDVRTS